MRYSQISDGSFIDINLGGDPRTPGVHLSGVIQYLAREMGIYNYDDEPQNDGNKFPLEARLKMAVGLSWENWVERQYPDVMYHPGELCQDGIVMTPDGLHPDEVLWEFKVTWKSMTRLITDGYDHRSFWPWRAQNMGYLKPLGWTRVHQCILFVNGNYKGERPTYTELDVQYTRQEIDDNWRLVLKHKDKANKE